MKNYEITITNELKIAAERFSGLGAPLFIVGGYVRDCLLGRATKDIDLASKLTPDELCSINSPDFSVTPVNPRLGTVLIIVNNCKFEHTTFRRESYGSGHSPNVADFAASINEDAFRRDFSVNALYFDILSGEIFDPTGHGITDLSERTLKTTTSDPNLIIADDGLRILRMVRCAAELKFKIDRSLFYAAKRNIKILNDISNERIFAELCRILMCDTVPGNNAEDLRRALVLLDTCGALGEIIPEMPERDFLVRNKYHKYPVRRHILYTTAATPPRLALRWAGLFHDISKQNCYERDGNMYYHAEDSAKVARTVLNRLRAPKVLTHEVCAIVKNHMYNLDGAASQGKLILFAVREGVTALDDLADFRRADIIGSGRPADFKSVEKIRAAANYIRQNEIPVTIGQLAISGEDVISLGFSGAKIGEILKRTLNFVCLHPAQNTKEGLIKYIKSTFKPTN